MKGTDRTVLLSLAMIGLLAAFYFMVLAPKRQEASKLGDEVTQLQTSIDQQNQVAQFAEQAREEFPRYYSRLVVLGKAVPEEADSASMLVQLNGVASRAGVDFRGISQGESSGEGSSTTSASAATTTPTTPASGTTTSSSGTPTPSASGATATTTTPSAAPTGDSATGGSSTATSATTSASPAPATEAAAATLPIGAVVGPAGLPTLPYSLKFEGSFFDAAGFISGLDSLVRMRDGKVAANGRLLTVDGFALSEPTFGPVPKLQVDFAVTSYVTPSDQGLTGGASPGGPAQPQTTPVAQ